MNHLLLCHDIFRTDFTRAENCFVYDAQGKCYVDLESGIWCTALGHGHPRVNAALREQMEQVIHLGTRYPSPLAEAAALEILEIMGMGDGKCTFLSSGSEAVEFGAQALRRLTRKPKLLTFSSSYLAAYGSAGRKAPADWFLFDWMANQGKSLSECLAAIPFSEIGGFVFEPGGSGSGFVYFPPRELVEAIAKRIHADGGLVQVNEITTGMGRTGKWFGFQHYAIEPDVVSIGKGLGNGYPVSAVAMKPAVAEALETSGLHYAQSHQNDPLGCAAALAVIAELRDGDWIEIGRKKGDYLLARLEELADKYSVVKEARGRGMLLGLELAPGATIDAAGLYHLLLERGFLTGFYPAGNMLRLDPALTIEYVQMDEFVDCLDGIFNSLH